MRNVAETARLLIALFIFSGCATSPMGLKEYSGPELPPEEVAIVKLANDLVFVGADDIKSPKLIRAATFSLLPGKRIIKLGVISHYKTKELYGNGILSMDLALLTTKFGGYRVIDIDVEAGHTYFITSEFHKANYNAYIWTTKVFDSVSGKQIQEIVYDGMLKPGTTANPRFPYVRD